MSQQISLAPGEGHDLAKDSLDLQVQLQFRPDCAWDLDPEKKATGAMMRVFQGTVLVRDVRDATEISVAPKGQERFPSGALVYATVVSKDTGKRITLPPLAVGEQPNAAVLRLQPEGASVRVVAPEATGSEHLDGASSTVHSVTKSLQKSAAPTAQEEGPRKVVVVVDHSASFQRKLTEQQRNAIAQVAAGLFSNSQFETRIVGTSAGSQVKKFTSASDFKAALEDAAQLAEVDWTRSTDQLISDGLAAANAVLVVSDDLPGQLAQLPRPMHILATREPAGPLPDNVSFTEFNEAFVSEVLRGDGTQLRRATESMYNALTARG